MKKEKKISNSLTRTYVFTKEMVKYLEDLAKKNRRSMSQTLRDCVAFYKNHKVTNNTHPPHDDDEAW